MAMALMQIGFIHSISVVAHAYVIQFFVPFDINMYFCCFGRNAVVNDVSECSFKRISY